MKGLVLREIVNVSVVTLLFLLLAAAWGLPGELNQPNSAQAAATFAESLR